ncbi:MAG: TonB-dependent receptor [Verrucomicrobia bacterium]|nr:TonB-dependent receptor [Verrucomicrobiota bacterium]
MKSSLPRSFLLAALTLGVPAFAADPLTKAPAPTPTPLAPIVVTASPIIDGNVVDRFGNFTTSVSARQIGDLNALDVSSALRRTPGVTISRFNPVGSYGGEEGGAVYVRGMGSSRPGSEIKTYVDGLPFYMGVWNHPLLDLLPVNGMSRIDVLKGPQPAEFGNTFGAINLIPKTAGAAEGVGGGVQLTAGSFSTFTEQFDLAGRQGAVDYSFAQGFAESDGHRPSADGRLRNFLGRVGYLLDAHWKLDVLALHVDNTAGDPGELPALATQGQRYDTSGSLVGVTISHAFEGLRGSLKFYDNQTEAVQRPGFTSTSEQSGLRLREEVTAWSGGLVTAGLDVDRMSGQGVNAFIPVNFTSEELTLVSPYVGLSQAIALSGGWTATPSAGVRFYDHSVFSSETAPHAGLVVSNQQDWAFRANVSRGVNYPGVEVGVLTAIMPFFGTSWRGLEAETMDHKELGATWTPTRSTTLDVAVFRDKVANRYVMSFGPSSTFANLGSYEVEGVELSAQQQLGGGLSLFAGLTTLSATKDDLPYAPANSVTLGLNWQQDAWSVSIDAQRQAGMTVLKQGRDGSTNSARVDGFTVANLRVGRKVPLLGERGEAFVAIENLFDEDYSFRAGYPMPGRSYQFGLRASF